jgi:hypothetical protein
MKSEIIKDVHSQRIEFEIMLEDERNTMVAEIAALKAEVAALKAQNDADPERVCWVWLLCCCITVSFCPRTE